MQINPLAALVLGAGALTACVVSPTPVPELESRGPSEVVGGSRASQASEWEAVVGVDALRAFMSGRKLSYAEGPAANNWGEYRADGTGTLHAWGTEFERRWEIEGDDLICIYGEPESGCYSLERSVQDPTLYRVTNAGTGLRTELRELGDGQPTVLEGAGVSSAGQGGPATPSATELALKLSNPANPIMKIGNNFDYTSYDGDLPGANDQSGFRYLFLTVFPFKLDNGNSLLFRPALPLIFDQPVPTAGGFSGEGTDLGDLAYDVIYSGTTKTGYIWGVGLAGTIPTATSNQLGADLWGAGPELLGGVAGKWGAAGGLLSHQWDFAGSGDGSLDLTSLNYFYGVQLGNGYQFAAGPTITYNHEAQSGEEWTIPLGVGISKTMVIAGRPWTFHVQYWNNIERPDSFAAEHVLRLSILPVISAPWNKGK